MQQKLHDKINSYLKNYKNDQEFRNLMMVAFCITLEEFTLVEWHVKKSGLDIDTEQIKKDLNFLLNFLEQKNSFPASGSIETIG